MNNTENYRLLSGHLESGDQAWAPGGLREIRVGSGTNILSVDLEMWHDTPCVEETLFLLELFRKKHAKATFFVLGSLAEREPSLIRQINDEGHEIGSHGWDHNQLFRKTFLTFRDEMKRSIDTLSGLVGKAVLGYRAAHFSINANTFWALDALTAVGVKYDSSIFPIAGTRYGVPKFPRGPVRIQRDSTAIIEVPLSTVTCLGKNLPVSGGGYFRLLPYPLIRRAVRAVNGDGYPFVAYCHPYEFSRERLRWPLDPGALGRLKTSGLELKFNLFRGGMREKLTRLLEEFSFSSFEEVLRDAIKC